MGTTVRQAWKERGDSGIRVGRVQVWEGIRGSWGRGCLWMCCEVRGLANTECGWERIGGLQGFVQDFMRFLGIGVKLL